MEKGGKESMILDGLLEKLRVVLSQQLIVFVFYVQSLSLSELA